MDRTPKRGSTSGNDYSRKRSRYEQENRSSRSNPGQRNPPANVPFGQIDNDDVLADIRPDIDDGQESYTQANPTPYPPGAFRPNVPVTPVQLPPSTIYNMGSGSISLQSTPASTVSPRPMTYSQTPSSQFFLPFQSPNYPQLQPIFPSNIPPSTATYPRAQTRPTPVYFTSSSPSSVPQVPQSTYSQPRGRGQPKPVAVRQLRQTAPTTSRINPSTSQSIPKPPRAPLQTTQSPSAGSLEPPPDVFGILYQVNGDRLEVIHNWNETSYGLNLLQARIKPGIKVRITESGKLEQIPVTPVSQSSSFTPTPAEQALVEQVASACSTVQVPPGQYAQTQNIPQGVGSSQSQPPTPQLPSSYDDDDDSNFPQY